MFVYVVLQMNLRINYLIRIYPPNLKHIKLNSLTFYQKIIIFFFIDELRAKYTIEFIKIDKRIINI